MLTPEKTAPVTERTLRNSLAINRTLYTLFVLLGIYFMIVGDDFIYGISNFGMALVFDPFDFRVKWNSRPRYQRIWLYFHVTIFLALFSYRLVFNAWVL